MSKPTNQLNPLGKLRKQNESINGTRKITLYVYIFVMENSSYLPVSLYSTLLSSYQLRVNLRDLHKLM